MALFGKKKKKATPEEEEAPPITLVPQGGATERDNQANLLTAKQSPAFILAQRLLADAIDRRTGTVLLDYTAQQVAVRYQIDGVWHQCPPLDRGNGDMLLAVLKTITALNMNERRARQEGKFAAQYKRGKHVCTLTSQGVPTGERATLRFDDPNAKKLQRIDDLSMRDKMVEQVRELFALHSGFLLISAPPGHGFTTTFNALLLSSDRYIRNFCEVADVTQKDPAVENVPRTTFDSAAGETPLSVLPRLIRQYHDVYVLRDLFNAETLDLLLDQAGEGRLIVGGIRAKECCEALLRVLAYKIPAAKFAPAATAVLNQRLVRMLCENCKEAYTPPPQVLQQLGIPQGKVAAFYRPHEGPLPPENEKEEPKMCPQCGGLGYRGRTAVFELLVLNDDLRKVLAKSPKLDVLRQEARKAGMRTLQEEGIVLVARGVTALPELLRVLKE